MSTVTYLSKVKFVEGFYKGQTGIALKEIFEFVIVKLDIDGKIVRELTSNVKLAEDE
jgi:hypothetical protein